MKAKYVLFFLLIGAFAAEIFLIMKFGQGKNVDKITLLLTIVGFYGIAIGFIKKSAIGESFTELLEEMTSYHPARFLAGNFTCMGLLLNFISIGFSKYRNPQSSMLLGFVGTLCMILAFPVVLSYVFFHIFVIMPLAYAAYLFSSAIVEAFTGASGDIEVTQRSADGELKVLKLKSIILKDKEASKSFIVGIHATIFSLVLKILEMFGVT